MNRIGYIPREQRKTILLLSDDLRMPSGIGTMSREIVVGTAHRYNWIQLAAGINHPDMGKVLDASESLAADTGVSDALLRLYPYNGYGDANIVRTLMEREKVDAIFHFTDPRYWVWLYQMEHELRERVPIMYYSVWDNLPFPKYNRNYYRSCDAIFAISKQTHNIHKNVIGKEHYALLDEATTTDNVVVLKYIPHGVNHRYFKPLTSDAPEASALTAFQERLFGGPKPEFAILYNNRNVRRKATSDVMYAFKLFLDTLPDAEKEKCRLILHTQKVDENGTDLPKTVEDCFPELAPYITWSEMRLSTPDMNLLYNSCDVVINMASAEGFGIATLEGLMAGRMFVANVTGGLQDQMGFRDEDGNLLNEDVHYDANWGSNADGRYQTHGSWVVPFFPNNRSLIGSPPTPYIYDDRCTAEDAAKAIEEVYALGAEERTRRGLEGREFALTNGMSADAMTETFVAAIDKTLEVWTSRRKFDLIAV